MCKLPFTTISSAISKLVNLWTCSWLSPSLLTLKPPLPSVPVGSIWMVTEQLSVWVEQGQHSNATKDNSRSIEGNCSVAAMFQWSGLITAKTERWAVINRCLICSTHVQNCIEMRINQQLQCYELFQQTHASSSSSSGMEAIFVSAATAWTTDTA